MQAIEVKKDDYGNRISFLHVYKKVVRPNITNFNTLSRIGFRREKLYFMV